MDYKKARVEWLETKLLERSENSDYSLKLKKATKLYIVCCEDENGFI